MRVATYAPATTGSSDADGSANREARPSDSFVLTQSLITSRSNVSPKRLVDPGPTPSQLEALFELAAAAPDHGQLTPWRFVVIAPEQRHLLAEVFALALIDRDPGATLDQIEDAREKAHRAPVLIAAVACLGRREPDIPLLERMVSVGAAIQNMLLGAYAMGYGGGLTSGQAMASPRMQKLLSLEQGESAVCCVNLGTPVKTKKPTRMRPLPGSFVRTLLPLEGVPQ